MFLAHRKAESDIYVDRTIKETIGTSRNGLKILLKMVIVSIVLRM